MNLTNTVLHKFTYRLVGKLNISCLMTLGFGAIVSVLAIVVLVLPPVPLLMEDMCRQVARSQEIIASLNTVLATLEDAESGQRNFLLTGNAAYIKRFEAAQARLIHDIHTMQQLTSTDTLQHQNAANLRLHTKARMNSLADTLALYKRSGLASAASRIRNGQGDREMLTARRILTDMHNRESRLLTWRINALNAIASQFKWMFGTGVATFFLLLCGLYGLLRRDFRLRRQRAEREHEDSTRSNAILESISDAFLALSFDWRFIYVNHEAELLIRKTRAQVQGNNIWELFPLAQGSDFDIEYHRVMEERVVRHFETYYAPDDRWYEVHVYPSARGITAYFRDISERVTSDERFRVLFEQSSDAHLLLDEKGIIDCNQAAVTLWGCQDKSQALALHPAVMSPPLQPDGRDSHEKALEMDALARERGYHRFEWTHRRPDGADFPVEVTLTPVILDRKPILLSVVHDLTERKRVEARAQAQYSVTRALSEADSLESACRPILQAVCEGMDWSWGAIWRVDEAANVLRCVDAWYRPDLEADEFLQNTAPMTFAPGAGLPGRVWLQYEPQWIVDVTQDSTFARADVAMRNDLHAAVAFPIRFEGKVAGVMELLSRETREQDMDQMMQLHALGSQIGQFMERKQAESELREAKRFSDSVARQSTSLIYVFDLETMSNVYVNHEITTFLGYTLAETQAMGRQYMPRIVHPDDLPYMNAHIAKFACMNDSDTLEFETRIKHASGEWRWLWFRERVFKRRADGTPSQIMGTAQDITERKRAEQQMQATNEWLAEANEHLNNLAKTDGLTGLFNHRAFQEQLAKDFERSERYQTPLSLLLMDVDKFKQYNDTFGHPAGDEVLKNVAKLLQTAARNVDVVARYGGEEFVIILPETDTEGALSAAERVRAAIAGAAWTERAITVSIGVATFTLHTPTQAALIEQADKALYASKTAGRNRVTHHNALFDLALVVEQAA